MTGSDTVEKTAPSRFPASWPNFERATAGGKPVTKLGLPVYEKGISRLLLIIKRKSIIMPVMLKGMVSEGQRNWRGCLLGARFWDGGTWSFFVDGITE
jgi:hypothetical protein